MVLSQRFPPPLTTMRFIGYKSEAMDDGELDFSNHEMFVGDTPSSGSMNSFFDEIFNDTHACTHKHTCNPPGPDSSHTHTCYNVHTKILPTTSDDDITPT